MISAHVAKPLPDSVELVGKYYAKPARKGWKLYADADGYSQTSGQVLKLGKVVRDAGDKAIVFRSLAAAELWISQGEPVVDAKFREIDFSNYGPA